MKDKKKNEKIDDIAYEMEEATDKIESKLDKIKKELKKCQQEKQEYLDGWQRSKADYINLKKRSDEEKNNIRKFGAEEMTSDLLGVVDSFEMAFKDKDAWNNAPESWRSGIEFIYSQLIKALENNGVIEINPLGEPFNPEAHNSVEILEVDEKEKDGIVVEVMQKGYSLSGRNIRPATVKVGQFKE